MTIKRSADQDVLQKAMDAFLQTQKDEATVRDLEQPLEANITGTVLYLPSATRAVMNRNHGAPVMAVETKTDVPGNRVFFSPAEPGAPGTRRLRHTESMGAAYVAFGVPLKKLKLKFTVSRRVVLPVHTLETPDHGIVYWISFADIQMEARNVDLEAIAATKKEKAATAKARKSARKGARKGAPAQPNS